jgi:hypothetical protein
MSLGDGDQDRSLEPSWHGQDDHRQNEEQAVIATLAHNLLRWMAAIGLRSTGLVVAKTLRRRLLTLPGRLTRSARQRRLHLPSRWPWATQFQQALTRLRALPAPN